MALADRELAGEPRSATVEPGRPLRLCFVCADYPTAKTEPLGIGGIAAHARRLANAVATLGHDVLVLSETTGPAEQYREGPVRVHALSRRSTRWWKLGRMVPVPWVRRSFAVWQSLQRLHREHPFDLIRFPDGYAEGFRFSLSPLAPYSVHLHGPASLVQKWDGRRVPPVRARVEAWLERRPATGAALLVTATRRFAEAITAEWSLDPQRIRIIRNPLDIDTFRPNDGPRRAARTILFAGHLQWLKGVATLAEAIPQVLLSQPDVRFLLVGNDTRSAPDGGSMRRFMEAELARCGALDKVSFLEPVTQRELAEHYRSSTVVVVPSYQEVFGNVLLEAMACGRPCVTTSAVGASELIASGDNGVVVPPRDAQALAGAICRLLTVPESARDDMGARARRTVEQACAAPVIAAQTIEAYRAVLRERSERFATSAGSRS
jgi:glycosyltransferase involved in cell wall biosynthesis